MALKMLVVSVGALRESLEFERDEWNHTHMSKIRDTLSTLCIGFEVLHASLQSGKDAGGVMVTFVQQYGFETSVMLSKSFRRSKRRNPLALPPQQRRHGLLLLWQTICQHAIQLPIHLNEPLTPAVAESLAYYTRERDEAERIISHKR